MSLYERFCQLDRSAKGFVSEDEFLSIPEFSTNPLSLVHSPSRRPVQSTSFVSMLCPLTDRLY